MSPIRKTKSKKRLTLVVSYPFESLRLQHVVIPCASSLGGLPTEGESGNVSHLLKCFNPVWHPKADKMYINSFSHKTDRAVTVELTTNASLDPSRELSSSMGGLSR